MIQFDSRKIQPGDIFVAIKGAHVDGNDYIKEALNRCASLIVANKKYPISNLIYTDNSVISLQRLGKYYKQRAKLIIGITGSCGKTTTKEWVKLILSKQCRVCATTNNANTLIGLCASLSLMQYGTDIGIFELGTNKPGEIYSLSQYLHPQIGIITNIFESHIGNFASLNDLINEKVSLIRNIRKHGYLLYDGDSVAKDIIISLCKQYRILPMSIGFSANCDFYIKKYQDEIIFVHNNNEITYNISAKGKQYAFISAYIFAVLKLLNLKINLQEFNCLSPLEGRGIVKKYVFNNIKFNVIDDCYNANPSSMKAGLGTVNTFTNRKILILGEMLELGTLSTYYHSKINDIIPTIDNSIAFFIGNKNLWPIMHACIKCYESVNERVIQEIIKCVQNEDVVFLKGSHSIGLQKFIEVLNTSF